MTFNKTNFITSLRTCLLGTEANEHADGADSFLFHDGKIFSHNGTVAVTVPIDDPDKVLEGMVNANDLYKIISKLNKDEFDIDVSKDKWQIKCGRMRAELVLKDTNYLSRITAFEFTDDWTDVPSTFQSAMKLCKMSHNKTIFSGIYYRGACMFSTDGFQINMYRFDDLEMPEFWISDKCADTFIRLSDIKSFQTDGKWVHMRTSSGVIVSAKLLISDKYPYDKIISLIDKDLDQFTLTGLFPPELFKAIDRAIMFGMNTDKGPVVKLVLRREYIAVAAGNTNGSYAESVDWVDMPSDDFKTIEMFVNSDILAFMLSNNCKFYIQKLENRPPNIYFVTPHSVHLFATYTVD